MKTYYLYILRCNDSSFYTGITSNLEKRLIEHNSSHSKSYTSTRLPVKLVYQKEFQNIYHAISSEKQIKKWSRRKKEALINNDIELLKKLAKSKSNS